MATTGDFTTYDRAIEKIVRGEMDFDAHTFKAVLVLANTALTAGFAGTSTDCRLADITQITGTGYTSGGVTVAPSISRVGGVVTLDFADAAWEDATLIAKGLVIYNDTHANKALVGFVDLNTDSSSATVSSTGGAFEVAFPTGTFTLGRAA